MDPAIEIQSAGWRDLRPARALEHACFGDDSWSVLDMALALAGAPVRLKAVAAGSMVGLVIGEPRPAEGLGWISTLGVHPAYQRQGIGGRLLAEAEARLGQPAVKLTVRRSNAAALALYARAGYRQVGVWAGYYSNGEDGLVMEKRRP